MISSCNLRVLPHKGAYSNLCACLLRTACNSSLLASAKATYVYLTADQLCRGPLQALASGGAPRQRSSLPRLEHPLWPAYTHHLSCSVSELNSSNEHDQSYIAAITCIKYTGGRTTSAGTSLAPHIRKQAWHALPMHLPCHSTNPVRRRLTEWARSSTASTSMAASALTSTARLLAATICASAASSSPVLTAPTCSSKKRPFIHHLKHLWRSYPR